MNNTMNLQPWFERKFGFEFGIEQAPCLKIRLRGTPVRLEEQIGALDRDVVTARRGDEWSIQENAGHLTDLEPLWLHRVDDFLEGRNELTPADLTNAKTHEADHNETSLSFVLAEFRAARKALSDRIESLEIQDFARTALHPRLKTPMRLVDLLFFVAEHDDHHLARMWDLERRTP